MRHKTNDMPDMPYCLICILPCKKYYNLRRTVLSVSALLQSWAHWFRRGICVTLTKKIFLLLSKARII